jgi:hypothetical protein
MSDSQPKPDWHEDLLRFYGEEILSLLPGPPVWPNAIDAYTVYFERVLWEEGQWHWQNNVSWPDPDDGTWVDAEEITFAPAVLLVVLTEHVESQLRAWGYSTIWQPIDPQRRWTVQRVLDHRHLGMGPVAKAPWVDCHSQYCRYFDRRADAQRAALQHYLETHDGAI